MVEEVVVVVVLSVFGGIREWKQNNSGMGLVHSFTPRLRIIIQE